MAQGWDDQYRGHFARVLDALPVDDAVALLATRGTEVTQLQVIGPVL